VSTLLEINELACRRGPIQALDGVSLSFRKGEFAAFAGLNGAGKSTLLEIMSGLLRTYSGSCSLEGCEVRQIHPRELSRRVSFLPQLVSAALPFLSEQIVLMGRFPHGDLWFESKDDRYAAEQAMILTGCLEFRQRPFDTLSGGERQRVLLASALSQWPRVLLLDEPGTFLDLPHQVQIFRTLRDLCRDGLLCVAATHDLNLAAAYCNRLVILDRGRVVIDAPPASAFDDPGFNRIFGPDVHATRTGSGQPLVLYGG